MMHQKILIILLNCLLVRLANLCCGWIDLVNFVAQELNYIFLWRQLTGFNTIHDVMWL